MNNVEDEVGERGVESLSPGGCQAIIDLIEMGDNPIVVDIINDHQVDLD
jgi:hypothetical protein